MQSKAPDVATYLQEVPQARQAALTALRALCCETLADHQEGMAYGMPTYSRNGAVEVAFASQKNYIALYIAKQGVLDAHRDLLQGVGMGKGCIRYTRPEKIDLGVVERLLVGVRDSAEVAC